MDQILAALHRGDQSDAMLENAAKNIAELSKYNELYNLPFGIFQRIIAKTSVMPVFVITKIFTGALSSYKSLTYCLIPLINCGRIGAQQAMMALAPLSEAPLFHEICAQRTAVPAPSPTKDTEIKRAPILKKAQVEEIKKTTEQKLSFIHYCETGKYDVVKKLLEENPKLVDERNKYGDYPIHKAVWNDHPNVVQLLLNYKADVNALDFDKATPLIKACIKNSHECVKILLDAGAKPNINSTKGNPLIVAAAKGNYNIMSDLLEHGADPNSCGKYLDTCLHIAAQRGYADIVNLLIQHGANINAENNRGEKPYDLAAKESIKNALTPPAKE